MDERKHSRFVDAKTVWSMPTFAAISRRGLVGNFMRRWRNENQIVAAGPKTAAWWGRRSQWVVCWFIQECELETERRRELETGEKGERKPSRTTTIKDHPPRALVVMLVKTTLLDRVLC